MAIHTVIPAEASTRTSHLRVGLLAVALVAVLGAAYSYGLQARAAAERAELALVTQENQSFCTGLGLAAATEVYARCESGLTAIRQRLRERHDAEAAGLL